MSKIMIVIILALAIIGIYSRVSYLQVAGIGGIIYLLITIIGDKFVRGPFHKL